MTLRKILLFLFLIVNVFCYSQKISLYKQFYGSYDFTMLGNTLNLIQNGGNVPCDILTESSATLNLQTNQTVEAAYLYWSGNGGEKEADLEVKLNGIVVKSQKENYSYLGANNTGGIFSAFADVTSIIKSNGNGNYILSNLDLKEIIPLYCKNNVNYGGWSITIIYKDNTIIDNLVAIYDGFEVINTSNPAIDIILDGFKVTRKDNSKVAFLAWEGDNHDGIGEELNINNKSVFNALNPADNAFNGTNSFTGSSELWNMDLDLYELDNYINGGDTSLKIQIKTGRDIVIINTVVLSLYSIFPDATIEILKADNFCNSRVVNLEFEVSNSEGDYLLKKGIPVSFYIGDELFATVETKKDIREKESLLDKVSFLVPQKYGDSFQVIAKVDDNGKGGGIVYERDEDNNESFYDVKLLKDCVIPKGVSPNRDGLNDSFDLLGFSVLNLKIFNRYGTLVYEHKEGYKNQWIGQDNNGRELPSGIYFYVFVTKDETFSNYVQLIREVN